jgi:shikimate dehydrogenase
VTVDVNNQVNGTTKILCIIGHPVRHSLSPAMQNAALRACGLDYVYVPFDVAPEGLGDAVTGLKALGVSGFNVTIPHKTDIMQYLDDVDTTAEAAGAVNTVKNKGGRLIGYNTDGDGLIRSCANQFGFNARGASVAIIGAGGAARGAIAALCRAGAGRIVIANRTRDRASGLASDMAARFPDTVLQVVEGFKALEEGLAEMDMLVNTTSLGMNRDSESILRLDGLPPTAVVYDMVYAPPLTPLLQEAAGLGLKAANGLGMLAAQGELAFTIWTGVTPPYGLMKSVLDGICDC